MVLMQPNPMDMSVRNYDILTLNHGIQLGSTIYQATDAKKMSKLVSDEYYCVHIFFCFVFNSCISKFFSGRFVIS